jgi:hypothetical protein
MIVAITGSRDGVSASVVQRGLREFIASLQIGHDGRHRGSCGEELHHHHDDHCTLEFRCGDARGVDLFARDWLRREGYIVDVYCASNANAERLELLNQRIMVQQSGRGLRSGEVVVTTPRTHYRSIVRCSDWSRDGRDKAGRIRNAQMLQRPELAHLLLKFHDGSSPPGTRHCADTAEQLGIEVVDGVELARIGGAG